MIKQKLITFVLWVIYQAAVFAFTGQRADGATIAAGHVESQLQPVSGSLAMASIEHVGRQTWPWSPKARHHAAVVRVQQGSSAGSGVYVAHNGLAGILTAKHCVADGGQIEIRWSDGHRERASGRKWDRGGADVAFVFLARPRRDVRPLAIADRSASRDDYLEVVGYGAMHAGPNRDGTGATLRHYYARPTWPRSGQLIGQGTAKPGPMHGDSGGLVGLYRTGAPPLVLSVVSAGSDPFIRFREGGQPGYSTLYFPAQRKVRAFVDRVSNAQYGPPGRGQRPPGGCGPGGCDPYGNGSPPIDDAFPPGGSGPQESYPPGGPDSWGPRRQGELGPAEAILILCGAALIGYLLTRQKIN